MPNCQNCQEKFLQAKMAHEAAKGRMYATNEFIALLKKVESWQLMEVVRCLECKHKGWVQEPCHGKSVDYCRMWECCLENLNTTFCSYGERKDGDGNG